MAGANLPAKKYKKTNPTCLRLSFEASGGGTKFIDIGKALSAINRKFYRAGVYYYVNSVEVYNDEQAVVDLHTLPDTWVTKNAWNRGFQLFQRMNSMTDSPISNVGRPKYHDFKVYMSDAHRQAGSLNPALYSTDGTYTTDETLPDDWAYSKFVSADSDGDVDPQNPQQLVQEADDFYVHMLGPHVGTSDNWTSIGLIRSYADTRPQPQQFGDPAIPAGAPTDPLVNVFDFSTEEQMNDIMANLESDNDRTPYNHDGYVGTQTDNMYHVARIGTEVGLGRVGRASGFCAPFGLICIDTNADSSYRVVLNLAAGTYHGVYAERA